MAYALLPSSQYCAATAASVFVNARSIFAVFLMCEAKCHRMAVKSGGDNIRCRYRIRGQHLMHRQRGDFVHYILPERQPQSKRSA